jgi:hypothetical protein
MKKTVAAINITIIAVINACKHETLIPGGTPPPGITPSPARAPVICFETDVMPIFVSNCAKPGCHNSITQAKGLHYDNYNDMMKTIRAGKPANSRAWKVISTDKPRDIMPPPPAQPLTKAQKDSIDEWIVQGDLNTTNCNTVCDTACFTFSGAIQPILQSFCIGCRSGGAAVGGGYDFTNFSTVLNVALNGKMPGAITHNPLYSPMPKGSNKLADCKISQVRKWMEAGTLNS